ncbi:hypothetical protein SCP_0400520 [Sparassis crispa]|uniref:F-box domain-containing protein n=1 Tax=Sparassis crispa TaxID=139825 RepID=A0A401GHT6_9APHY|nr:hypothetical protein SCP_0400520 [Sparassis crispa]GBE81681.1 hypothetical protein SCP_0400520 [Sparassis crispa]
MDSASGRLPLEVHEYILDHLWDDHSTLAVCSLTCRVCLPTTRFHLFRRVSLASYVEYTRFERLLDECPGIAHHVRTLLICNAHHVVPMNRDFTRILLRLQNVEYLTLNCWRAYQMSNETRKNLQVCFPAVKTIVLEDSHFCDHDFPGIILACPRLTAIHLIGITSSSSSSPPIWPLELVPAGSSPESQVDTLVWSFSSNDTLVWLLNGPSMLRLRELQLSFFHSDIHPEVENLAQQLLHAAGASLQRLSLGISPTFGTPNVSHDTLHLSRNPNLEWLQLKGIILDGDRAIHFSSILCSIVSQIQPCHTKLRQIQAELIVARISDIAALRFEQFDETLAALLQDRQSLEVLFHVCNATLHSRGHDFQAWAREVSDVISTGLPRVRTRLLVECADAGFPHAGWGGPTKSRQQVVYRYSEK